MRASTSAAGMRSRSDLTCQSAAAPQCYDSDASSFYSFSCESSSDVAISTLLFPSLRNLHLYPPSPQRNEACPARHLRASPPQPKTSKRTATMSDATSREAQQKLLESTSAMPTSTGAQQSDNVAHALAGAGGGLLSMALTYVFPPCAVCSCGRYANRWTIQIPAHHPLYARPSRIKARPILHPQRRAPHHQARGHHGPIRRSRIGTLRNQCYQLRILLLLVQPCTPCRRGSILTMASQGTNGHALSSKRPLSRPAVPHRNSQPLNP